MVQKTKCRNCRATYELIWDDVDIDDWRDDFEDENDFDSDEEELDDPAYCPFCGAHCDGIFNE